MDAASPTQEDATPKAGARKMMGTMGKLDYAIVAVSGLFALGIKLIFRAAPNPSDPSGPPLLFAGFRVRSAKDPDQKDAVHSAEDCAAAFPGIQWSKIGVGGGNFRASTEIGIGLPCNYANLHLAPAAAKQARFTQKMMAWIIEHLTTEGVKPADLLELDADTFRQVIDGAIGKQFYPVTVGKLIEEGPPGFQDQFSKLVEEYAGSLPGELEVNAQIADSIEDAGAALQGLAEQSATNEFAGDVAGGPQGIDSNVPEGIEQVGDDEEIVETVPAEPGVKIPA